MYLYLNTSSSKKIILTIFNQQGKILNLKNISAQYQQSEKLILEINKLLKAVKCSIPKIKGFLVISGPGSFTALRIGLATANTLAWALNVPVLGIQNKKDLPDQQIIDKNYKKIVKCKKFTKQVLPIYGKQPNITIK